MERFKGHVPDDTVHLDYTMEKFIVIFGIMHEYIIIIQMYLSDVFIFLQIIIQNLINLFHQQISKTAVIKPVKNTEPFDLQAYQFISGYP